jgi:Sap, sulfolipid-1-addressing protein
MGQGISAILTFAIGVAISPVPIIAVILMLFSERARVNGPAFLVGWVVALAAVSTVVYVLSHDGNVAQPSSIASDSVSWGTIALGVGLLALARRNWRKRPARGEEPTMPKWLATVESLSPLKALGLGIVLAAVNPKNLILTAGAAAGLAQVSGLSTTDAVVAIVVFVVIASLTIAGPVVYALVGGARAKATLDSAKSWLTVHNAAVMAVLFLVFGVDLIAKGLPPLTR